MTTAEFKLPRGVTGLSNKNQTGNESFAKFKSTCYEAARRDMGRASRFVRAGVTPNFHQATIKVEQKSLIVVCNGKFKFIAFANESDAATLEFIDEASLAMSFKLQGYKVLDSALLSKPLNTHNCSELGKAESEQVEYWRSKTVGEVIFNWFD